MSAQPIYLDHAATAFPKAPGVAAAVADFLERSAGNPGRGGHALSLAAARAVESAREEIAALLGAAPERTLFGPGATFWLNTVLAARLAPGSRVVTSAREHNAVMRPLRHLERERGIEIEIVPGTDPEGVPAPAEIAAAVARAPTALVVLNHASNLTGALAPLAALAAAAAPVPLLVDAAQSAGALPLEFDSLGVAACACSGHKSLLGPSGTGVLLLAPGFTVEPLVRGGTGSRSESELMPAELPDRLEAGTPNTAGIAGLGAAARWLAAQGPAALHARALELARRLAAGLEALPGARLFGWDADAQRLATLSFALEGLDSGELAAWLDREHAIMMRVGLHCAPAAHRRLGTFPGGTLRAAIGPFNTAAQIDTVLAALERARREV